MYGPFRGFKEMNASRVLDMVDEPGQFTDNIGVDMEKCMGFGLSCCLLIQC